MFVTVGVLSLFFFLLIVCCSRFAGLRLSLLTVMLCLKLLLLLALLLLPNYKNSFKLPILSPIIILSCSLILLYYSFTIF